ncbi:Outer membrane efflux protein [Verrucomicrobia bacterium]|nr:Outer membrane efflux protein [Verrucomicrobiota bacterium]
MVPMQARKRKWTFHEALRWAVCTAAMTMLTLAPASAQGPTNTAYPGALPTALLEGAPITNEMVLPIDLPTTLRLAGARNLDVQIARESLGEAEASRQSAVEQFFPWVSPGVGYHRRDGVAQAVPSGVISDAHFQSYSPGAALTAQMVLGDAIYNSLVAKQLVKASDQALETQRQDTVLSAAQGYFDLVEAKALVEVSREAIQISQDYQQELHAAVSAGIAFRGDELRVQTQTEQYKIGLERGLEQQLVASASLTQVLHLDSRVELAPLDDGLMPLKLFLTNASVNALVDQAMRTRPELKQSQAFLAASRAAKTGAVYGPLIPSVGAQAFGGGLGGGPDSGPNHFGAEGDYTVGLSWRIGPGGLFDSGRVNASKARLAAAQFTEAKLKDTIISQVVAGLVRVKSTAAQIDLAERNLNTASETLKLTRQRKQYGVGVVLEDIQAQQALTQARSDYASAVAENAKAQYALDRATGSLAETQDRQGRGVGK